MSGGPDNFARGGRLRAAGWWRWPLAWLGATGLVVGLLVVSVVGWLGPTNLITLGEPPSMRIVRVIDGRLYYIRFKCTDPASPAAMRPEMVDYRRNFLRPRPMELYFHPMGDNKNMFLHFGRRELESGLYRDERALGVRLKPIFLLSLALYVGFTVVFAVARRPRASAATHGFPVSINAPTEGD